MSIAGIILEQLGGGRFIAMTGSKNFVDCGNALSMHLTRNRVGAKFLKIELKGDDTYTMTFSKLKNNSLVVLKEFDMIYNDQLQEIFTSVTGLYTRLF